MGEFEHIFEVFKMEMRDSAARQDQKLKESADRCAKEMRDV